MLLGSFSGYSHALLIDSCSLVHLYALLSFNGLNHLI